MWLHIRLVFRNSCLSVCLRLRDGWLLGFGIKQPEILKLCSLCTFKGYCGYPLLKPVLNPNSPVMEWYKQAHIPTTFSILRSRFRCHYTAANNGFQGPAPLLPAAYRVAGEAEGPACGKYSPQTTILQNYAIRVNHPLSRAIFSVALVFLSQF